MASDRGFYGEVPQTQPKLNDLQLYLVEEFVADYRAGRLSRRDMIKRVLGIAGGIASAATLLLALGCQSEPAKTTPPSSTTPAPDTTTRSRARPGKRPSPGSAGTLPSVDTTCSDSGRQPPPLPGERAPDASSCEPEQ